MSERADPNKAVREAIEATISHLTGEFIVEECADEPTEGCLSCEMIETRASLRKALSILNDDWSFEFNPSLSAPSTNGRTE